MHGTFIWNELTTTDVEGAKAAYGELLGWTFQKYPMENGEYFLAQLNGKNVAGLSGLDLGALTNKTTSYWFSFLEVDDVDARVDAARKKGFAVLREPADLPNVGRVAVVQDPSGASVGWMTVTGIRPNA